MDIHAWGNIFTAWPHDWILIGAIVIFISLDSLRSGSARAASLALALPATLFAVNAIPQTFFLGPLVARYPQPFIQVGIFAVMLVLIYFATYRTVFAASDGGRVVQSLIIGLAAAAALVVVWLQVPALDYVWHFGPQVQTVFAPAYRFWWLVGVFFALAFARS